MSFGCIFSTKLSTFAWLSLISASCEAGGHEGDVWLPWLPRELWHSDWLWGATGTSDQRVSDRWPGSQRHHPAGGGVCTTTAESGAQFVWRVCNLLKCMIHLNEFSFWLHVLLLGIHACYNTIWLPLLGIHVHAFYNTINRYKCWLSLIYLRN